MTKYREQPDENGVSRSVPVLRGVGTTIPDCSLSLLMGPSGSGKSTLLRLLNRLEDPDEGEILLDGAALQSLPVLDLRRRVVLVGQLPAVFAGTVADNLAYGLRLQRRPAAEVAARAGEALAQVGLSPDLLARPAEHLSVGQQRRVCLARALALRPGALLLDEPTAALDPASARIVVEQIRTLHEALGITVVYVTHHLSEAKALGGQALVLAGGVLVESGPASEVLTRPRAAETRAFLAEEAAGA